jgi:Tfp pilus assembly protein PilW
MINNVRQSQQGLSLIELMIAITLSILITAAMISLFVNSKQNYRLNENMSRLQENARFAMSFLARDIRMADYRSCVTADRLATAIAGTNNTGLNNSDTVTVIWQTNACDAGITSDTTIYSIRPGSSGAPALFRSVNGVTRSWLKVLKTCRFYMVKIPIMMMRQIISLIRRVSPIWRRPSVSG